MAPAVPPRIPCASPALATKPSPSSPGTEDLLGWPGCDKLIREFTAQSTKPQPRSKQGQGLLGAGPALQSHVAAKTAPPTAWSPSAVVGHQSNSSVGEGVAPRKVALQILTAPASEAVGDTTAVTLEMKVPFLAALLRHPGDQLCHGTRGLQLCCSTPATLASPQHPADSRFFYEQSWDRSFSFKCWDLTSQTAAWPSSAHRVQPVGAQNNPHEGLSHSWHPLCPSDKCECCFVVSFTEPAISAA